MRLALLRIVAHGIAAAALVVAAGAAAAQTVSLAGSMGAGKALLMVDGQPHVLAVGDSAAGVTLRRLDDGTAEVSVAGRISTLRLGATPGRIGAGAAPPADTAIVLPAGPGGHFVSQGTINGRSVRFMVDTGATTVAISQSEANRIGLDWKGGQPVLSHTANGAVPSHAVTLGAVRLGGVELNNVAAVVVPAEMPMVLLGNSFLARFSMRRDGDVMRLEKIP